MITNRRLALAAAVIASSAAILASPASANPGILDRLADLEARGTSSESRVTRSPLTERTELLRGVEVAGAPVARSSARPVSDSGILGRLAALDARGTSSENQVPRSPLAARNELIRGVEIAGPPTVSRDRDSSTIFDRLHDLSSVSRESSVRY